MLRELFAMAAAVALGAPVEPVQTGPGTRYYDGWPPARYLVETRMTVILAPFDRVQAFCALGGKTPLPDGWHFEGCYRDGLVVTFLPVPGDGENFARIIAHEMAHRNAWQGDHPL